MSMEENPYKPPEAYDRPIVGVRSGQREDLRKVAIAQKVILFCILINFAALGARFVLPPQALPAVFIVLVLAGLVSTIFTIVLAIRVYNLALGIILGLLAFIPCIGLLVLLMVNQKATSILQANGLRVGLLGADLEQI
jgi:hypothetical protein